MPRKVISFFFKKRINKYVTTSLDSIVEFRQEIKKINRQQNSLPYKVTRICFREIDERKPNSIRTSKAGQNNKNTKKQKHIHMYVHIVTAKLHERQ